LKLTAGDETLHNLTVAFKPNAFSDRISITGKLGEKVVPASLGDLHSGCCIHLPLTVKTFIAGVNRLELSVLFSTPLSGDGDFERILVFEGQSPFRVVYRFWDSNFQNVRVSDHPSPVFDTGVSVGVAIDLRNVLGTSVTIDGIDSNLKSVDVEGLPVTVRQDEVFSFVGEVSGPEQTELTVKYCTDVIGSCRFNVRLPKLRFRKTPLRFGLEAPSCAVRDCVIEAKLTIEAMEEEDKAAEMFLVRVEIMNVPGFFGDGPIRRCIPVMRGQRKVVPIRFMALEAGSMTLPPIVLTDVSRGERKEQRQSERRIVVPILVTFR
jgi:hypothetical protein